MHTGFGKPIPILKLNEHWKQDQLRWMRSAHQPWQMKFKSTLKLGFWLCSLFSHPVLHVRVFNVQRGCRRRSHESSHFHFAFVTQFFSMQFVGLLLTSVSALSMHRNKHEVSHKHGSNFKVHWKIWISVQCVCNVHVCVCVCNTLTARHILVDWIETSNMWFSAERERERGKNSSSKLRNVYRPSDRGGKKGHETQNSTPHFY